LSLHLVPVSIGMSEVVNLGLPNAALPPQRAVPVGEFAA
jgi:hypothetical protein